MYMVCSKIRVMPAREGTRRQVLVPDELWDPVQMIAEKDHSSASQIVREALTDYIRKRIRQSRREKAHT